VRAYLRVCVCVCVRAYLRACVRGVCLGCILKAFRCIELKVWDYDLGTFGTNDFLGQVVLPLNLVAPQETCDRFVRRLLRTIMHVGSMYSYALRIHMFMFVSYDTSISVRT
jgi:hypothetical protein